MTRSSPDHTAGQNLLIRDMRPGEEPLLWQVFHSSVHGIASRYYSPAQVKAWSPLDLDPVFWASRMASIRPYVAERQKQIVGYTDLQPNGYIDHFFVAAKAKRQGVGTALMRHTLTLANQWQLRRLSAHVSLAAQVFFNKHGFQIVEKQTVTVRGVEINHALMVLDI